jgi:hypothetical protein
VTNDVLASDAERDAAALELRRHLAEGRLTTEEFGERVETVYAARSRAELAEALSRLPAGVEAAPQRPALGALALRQAGYLLLPVIICTLVWAFTGMHGGFWPKWVILGVTIAFVSRVGKAALGDEQARAELERRPDS